MKTLWTIVTLLIMAVGLAGTVLPFIPGILLIYAGYLLYGFATGWQAYGLAAIVGWSVVTGLVLLLDFYGGTIGAKRYGASRSGAWGSLIGGLIGTLAAGFPGLILGPPGIIPGCLIPGLSDKTVCKRLKCSCHIIFCLASSKADTSSFIDFIWLTISGRTDIRTC